MVVTSAYLKSTEVPAYNKCQDIKKVWSADAPLSCPFSSRLLAAAIIIGKKFFVPSDREN